MTPVVLCSFDPSTGWRIRGSSSSRHAKAGVVKIGPLKLLRVPGVGRGGQFCNPRRLLCV